MDDVVRLRNQPYPPAVAARLAGGAPARTLALKCLGCQRRPYFPRRVRAVGEILQRMENPPSE